jgi:Zn ribbon nucleic-acid-binding protein
VSALTWWKKENVSVTKCAEFLGKFKSSEISDRRYCTKCGGHVRNFPFTPAVHLNYEETVLPMKDGLPKLKDFPASIGGSGETLPE